MISGVFCNRKNSLCATFFCNRKICVFNSDIECFAANKITAVLTVLYITIIINFIKYLFYYKKKTINTRQDRKLGIRSLNVL